MAMTPLWLELLRVTLDQGFPNAKGLRIVSLGYPDMIATTDEIRQKFGDSVAAKLTYRDDAEDIRKWHSAAGLDRVADTYSFFSALGHRLDCIDYKPVRGGEIVHNLNERLPEALRGQYDIAIDTGTVEHCFNVAEAQRSTADLVRAGGCVIQGIGLNYYNHGFYNFSPTFVKDFFGQNGFELMWAEGLDVQNHGRNTSKFDFDWEKRFTLPESMTNAGIYYIVRRETLQPIVWPIQGKYLDHPDLKRPDENGATG